MALSSPPTELLNATALRMSAIPTLLLDGCSSLALALVFAAGISSAGVTLVAVSGVSSRLTNSSATVISAAPVGFRPLVVFLAIAYSINPDCLVNSSDFELNLKSSHSGLWRGEHEIDGTQDCIESGSSVRPCLTSKCAGFSAEPHFIQQAVILWWSDWPPPATLEPHNHGVPSNAERGPETSFEYRHLGRRRA